MVMFFKTRKHDAIYKCSIEIWYLTRNRLRNVEKYQISKLFSTLFIERRWFHKPSPGRAWRPRLGRGRGVCFLDSGWMWMCYLFFFLPFGWKFINMCYFNYVECKFDVALPLFLYFLSLLLFSPRVSPEFTSRQEDLGRSARVWVMHTRCVWTHRHFQGALPWKETTHRPPPPLLWGEKHAEGVFGRARRPPVTGMPWILVLVTKCILSNHIVWM